MSSICPQTHALVAVRMPAVLADLIISYLVYSESNSPGGFIWTIGCYGVDEQCSQFAGIPALLNGLAHGGHFELWAREFAHPLHRKNAYSISIIEEVTDEALRLGHDTEIELLCTTLASKFVPNVLTSTMLTATVRRASPRAFIAIVRAYIRAQLANKLEFALANVDLGVNHSACSLCPEARSLAIVALNIELSEPYRSVLTRWLHVINNSINETLGSSARSTPASWQ